MLNKNIHYLSVKVFSSHFSVNWKIICCGLWNVKSMLSHLANTQFSRRLFIGSVHYVETCRQPQNRKVNISQRLQRTTEPWPENLVKFEPLVLEICSRTDRPTRCDIYML